MMAVVFGLLKTVGLNLLAMLVGPKMIIWLLRLASKSSDNKIDDHLVTVVEGAYDSDQKKVQEGLSKLVAVWNEEKKEVIPEK